MDIKGSFNSFIENAKQTPKLKLGLIIASSLFMFYIIFDLFFSTDTSYKMTMPNNSGIIAAKGDSLMNASLNNNDDHQKPKENLDDKKETPKDSDKKIEEAISGIVFLSYNVKKGDNIDKIASRFNISKSEIKKLNALQSDKLKEKQKIKIPIKAKHKARKGETIAKLSKKYNVSSKVILKANKMTEDKELKPGKTIYIPIS
ncbi:MAG: LysM peptidoglycan-binding domain-containing protein [Bacteroidetes bacterium]|nr:LysM peptidoglycan-binding domain-containing protein [Bacteroidota bacterium]